MASKAKQSSKRSAGGSGSAVTAPKGRATASRGATSERGSRLSPTMEWVIALVVVLVVLVGVFLIWGDVRTPLGGGHSGLGPIEPSAGVVVDGLG